MLILGGMMKQAELELRLRTIADAAESTEHLVIISFHTKRDDLRIQGRYILPSDEGIKLLSQALPIYSYDEIASIDPAPAT